MKSAVIGLHFIFVNCYFWAITTKVDNLERKEYLSKRRKVVFSPNLVSAIHRHTWADRLYNGEVTFLLKTNSLATNN